MNIQDLLNYLEYSNSSYFITGPSFNEYPAYSHSFRLAQEKCGLEGVFALKGSDANLPLGRNILPLVYVCKANSEAEATKFHKLIWNQNIVPFFIVETPKCFRLYPGFKFDTRTGMAKDQSILEIAKTANAVLSNLSDFRATSINNGAMWSKWGEEVTPEKRVDTKLLNSLKSLSTWLQEHNMPRNAAHALIGKYVYLHYLKDRDILSDRKLSQWGIEEESVFGRNATLEGFYSVTDQLDQWLNGTVFPIPDNGPGVPSTEHIKMVASTFLGDDPNGQMHLDFKAYDFQYIPIETLSMVYQQFLHAEGKGRGQGAFYTPIHLVNFILDELDTKRPLQKGMTVLDPACGSGAFLVQCFRRLIERETMKLPNKKLSPFTLRELLIDHIWGVEVDEDACGVTELSLILTLLDYVDPPDLEKSEYKKFQLPPLRDMNIFCCNQGFFESESSWQTAKPMRGYDWIVGNPPWKNLNSRDLDNGDESAVEWIKINNWRFPVSSNQIAEAFAWEVTQHLSTEGLIGLLLPAGTLFKTNGKKFREKFFSTLRVWCVVNFANLRHHLFQGAVNPAAAFFYSRLNENDKTFSQITTFAPFAVNQLTHFEPEKHKHNKLWTILVNANEIKEIPWAEVATGNSLPWKIAMWGSHRDRFLILSLAKQFPSLLKFKEKHDLKIHPGLELRNEQEKEPIEYLKEVEGKKELDINALKGLEEIYAFPNHALKPIESNRAFVRKGRGKIPLQVCYPPHIIVHAARKFAVFSNEFIVVPPRQIGISGKPSQLNLLKAMALYLNSDFVLYHQFLTSTYWGIERDRPDKSDLENLPIPLEMLSSDEIIFWAQLYDDLAKATSDRFLDSESPLFDGYQKEQNTLHLKQKLNDAVYSLLGITKTEKWLIEDLLFVRKEMNEGRLAKEATKPANKDDINKYAKALKTELDNFLDAEIKDQHRITVHYNRQVAIIKIEHPKNTPAGPVTVLDIETRSVDAAFDELKSNLLSRQGQWIYFNRNLKIYKGRTTYFVKPRERLCWLRSQALLDADEFIAEKLT
ncbi:MAG: N-6 DNA methylase [Pseudomonadota bacterium]